MQIFVPIGMILSKLELSILY